MKRLSILFVLVVAISAIGAGPIAQQADVPRDTTGIETTLTAVNDAQADYLAKVAVTDDKRAALDQAQLEFDQAIADESASQANLETAQQAYADAYEAFPKGDELSP